jgi:hypothetical protein
MDDERLLLGIVLYIGALVFLSAVYWVGAWFGVFVLFYGDCCVRTDPPGAHTYWMVAKTLYAVLTAAGIYFGWRLLLKRL